MYYGRMTHRRQWGFASSNADQSSLWLRCGLHHSRSGCNIVANINDSCTQNFAAIFALTLPMDESQTRLLENVIESRCCHVAAPFFCLGRGTVMQTYPVSDTLQDLTQPDIRIMLMVCK